MAGLLTGSRPDSFPAFDSASGKSIIGTLNGGSQQRGLSGIHTRFPFNPDKCHYYPKPIRDKGNRFFYFRYLFRVLFLRNHDPLLDIPGFGTEIHPDFEQFTAVRFKRQGVTFVVDLL